MVRAFLEQAPAVALYANHRGQCRKRGCDGLLALAGECGSNEPVTVDLRQKSRGGKAPGMSSCNARVPREPKNRRIGNTLPVQQAQAPQRAKTMSQRGCRRYGVNLAGLPVLLPESKLC